jgi:hypothetical protein
MGLKCRILLVTYHNMMLMLVLLVQQLMRVRHWSVQCQMKRMSF